MISAKRFRPLRELAIAGVMTTLIAGPAVAEAVRTVNGVDIDQSVFEAYLAGRLQKPADQATPQERSNVLDELTDIYLLTTQPRARELASDEDLKAQIELQYRGLLAQAVASDFMSNNAATEDEIFTEYTTQIQRSPSQQFKARHILVETQSEAIELIGQLKEGADFVELAKEKSTGPSGPSGGDLGWFSPEQMVAPFSAAVADLEDGAFTQEPVQTQFGWHVILREESRANEPPTLESVREIVKQQVESQKFQQYLEGLRAERESE